VAGFPAIPRLYPSSLSFRARLFISVVLVAGLAILAQSAATLIRTTPPTGLLLLGVLALLRGHLQHQGAGRLCSYLHLRSLRLCLRALVRRRGGNTCGHTGRDDDVGACPSRQKVALSRAIQVAASALALWASAQVFHYIAGSGRVATNLPLDEFVLPLGALAASYFLFSTGLVAIAMSLEKGAAAFTIWRTNFLWFGLNYMVGASFAALIVTYRQQFDLALLVVIVPLLVITYLTVRTSTDAWRTPTGTWHN